MQLMLEVWHQSARMNSNFTLRRFALATTRLRRDTRLANANKRNRNTIAGH